MDATAWSDYVCPWAYLGRDRTALMRRLGVSVTVLPYELHPEIPPEGVAVRPGGRLDRVFGVIAAECEQLGIDFRAPTRSPNTHHVLEVAEVVRLHAPDAFAAFDESLSRAHWVDGADLGDRDLVRDLLARSGAPVDDVVDLVADGAGTAALAASMAQARSVGVMATPAWWVDEALLIPGAQPRDTIERWITKMLAARARAGAEPDEAAETP
jgi:predicted DsbA family dithiol-disulfide isomerase